VSESISSATTELLVTFSQLSSSEVSVIVTSPVSTGYVTDSSAVPPGDVFSTSGSVTMTASDNDVILPSLILETTDVTSSVS
jgi:hypothetical protein